jgi:hypothetical protein
MAVALLAVPFIAAAAGAAAATPPPISFSLGGAKFHSAAPGGGWEATAASFAASGGRSLTDFTWTHAGGLQAQVKQTAYGAAGTAGAVEWVLSFRNTGAAPSPQRLGARHRAAIRDDGAPLHRLARQPD